MEFQTQQGAGLEQTTLTQEVEPENTTSVEQGAGPENATPTQQEAGSNEVTPRSSLTDEEPANIHPTNSEEEQEVKKVKDGEKEQQEKEEPEEENQENHEEPKDEGSSGDEEAAEKSEQDLCRSAADRPAPPTSLALSAPTKKKVLVAPALSLSLGGDASLVSEDFPGGFLSPSPEDDTGLDIDLDAMDTPSDSESLAFPFFDPDLEDDLQRLGVATHRRQPSGSTPDRRSRSGSGPGTDHSGLGAMDREDVVDEDGTRWRRFSSGDPPQESRVNMSVLQPYLQVLSHGGYYGDGTNDIIVFSSCYLPESSIENYQYVMDHLFRFVVGTLDLMVSQNYVIVYLCAGGQKDKLPGIGWLRECYTTIARRLRKSLKGFYVVHPTWYIKALITITKPFISSKFTKKLQFIETLQDLLHFIPTEHMQIPDCVQEYDNNLSR